MRFLDLTLPTPELNLALDDALLEEAEIAPDSPEVLRVWEPTDYFVVVGRSSSMEEEVNLPECRARGIGVFRRSSGGATVVLGPGCLNFSLRFDLSRRPHLRSIEKAHRLVMATHSAALSPLVGKLERQGISDLTFGGRKVSGTAIRVKRNSMLYHGTLLYSFSIPLVEQLLRIPRRSPEYRRGRCHEEFLTNLPIDRELARKMLQGAWQADEVHRDWPRPVAERLSIEKYLDPDWTFRI